MTAIDLRHFMANQEEKKSQSSIERVLSEAAPTLLATAIFAMVGLLWNLQSSVSEIKSNQVRVLDLIKDSQNRLSILEERVRLLEIGQTGSVRPRVTP